MDAVPPALVDVLGSLSRELWLVVDATGTITACDARAAARGFTAGTPLRHLAVPGTDGKIAELVRQGLTERLANWELALVLQGRPITLACQAAPVSGQVALVCSVMPQDYADHYGEGARVTAEVVLANRELARQKARLEDSYQGIRTLHAELEVQADRARTSAEVKGRLVSSVSHELRTPLHSILGLSRLLLDGSDGPLNSEQQRQLEFIRTSAQELSVLVNDMLDLARLDAGNATIRTDVFELHDFLGGIRGTMAPLVPADASVQLIFDDAPNVPLETDQGKLAQIVRNLVSNALKFTLAGTVRVSATLAGTESDNLRIVVADTGIGIAPEDQARVFEEFVQIESAQQRRVKGTGLGLPLAKKLAATLGGRLELASELGRGSTFTVTVPLEHLDVDKFRQLETRSRELDPERTPVLVVEDDRDQVFVYEQFLAGAGFQVLPARTVADAREILRRVTPSAVLLDVMLEQEDTWNFLAELKRDPRTKDIPVLVCTVMNRESHARALGADEFWLKPVDQDRLIQKLDSLASPKGVSVLVIDDDPAARYLIQKYLANTSYKLSEAGDGATGVKLARETQPNVILLDFLLDNITAFDVLDELKADPRTRSIPVIIVTSHALPLEDRRKLGAHATAILSKETLSRELAIHRIRDALRTAGIKSANEKGR